MERWEIVEFHNRILAVFNRKYDTPFHDFGLPVGDPHIDGQPLTEVAATLWYLARCYPEAGLLPQYGDSEGDARINSWMSFIASTIHPARRTGNERWREVFALAEQRLGRNEWTVDRYSIADIHLFVSAR